MPRPKSDKKEYTICIPSNIAKKLEEKFYDPKTGKREHGALSDYLTKLIIRDLREASVALSSIDDLLKGE
jgi:hypothetical protein